MAELTAFRNNALPYPVYGAPWTVVFPLLDADGDPVTGATCDSEVSKNGDTAVDCTNEGAEIPFTTATNKGMYYLTLTAAEMTADIVTVTIYSATSKATPIVLYPRKLVTLASGTSAGGAVGYITLAAASFTVDAQFGGCLCVATIDAGVEARVLQVCTQADQQCTVTPNWNVAPDADDTYIIYLPEGRQMPAVNVTAIEGADPTDTIRDSVVDDATRIDASDLNTLSGHDPGANIGTSTLTQAQVTGGAYALNATASGNVGIDWANVENPGTAVDLALTDIQLCDTITTYTGNTLQTADVNGVPTTAEFNARTLVAAGYFDPANDAVAVVTLVTTTTTNSDMRGTDLAALAATALTDVTWTDAKAGFIDVAITSRSSHTAANVWAVGARTLTSFGTLVADTTTAVWAAGTRTLTSFGTLVADVTTAVWAAGARTLTSFGTLVADTATAVWAAVARTLTAATNITSTGGTTVPQTGDSFARLGAPAGASTAADIAALKAVADATLVDTGTTLPATLTSLMGATFATGTDSMEAIRNRGDAAWTTGAGGDATVAGQTLIKEGIAALADKTATAPAYMGGTFDPAADSEEAIRDRGDAAWTTGAGGTAGPGADAVTLTIEDDAGDPVANADVWISTDEAGDTVVAGSLSSNDVGEVEFMLDEGVTYYCWRAKAGINFDNPATFVAVAD